MLVRDTIQPLPKACKIGYRLLPCGKSCVAAAKIHPCVDIGKGTTPGSALYGRRGGTFIGSQRRNRAQSAAAAFLADHRPSRLYTPRALCSAITRLSSFSFSFFACASFYICCTAGFVHFYSIQGKEYNARVSSVIYLNTLAISYLLFFFFSYFFCSIIIAIWSFWSRDSR